VDGFALAERLRSDRPDDFRILTETPVPGRYIEPGVHLRAERCPIRLDRHGALEQVTFNNYDRAPFILPPDEMAAFYRAYGALHEMIVDQENWLKIRLEPGLALIFDNWRLLHGRMGYAGRRVFCGCYHNREDFESRLRTTRFAA
jgi:alpha-ketoglutarate-dependent taurine dioxygenase